jgi:hypothetical protein
MSRGSPREFVQRVLGLFERFIILACGMTLTVAMLYVAGNYQGFSDTTQRYLLEAARILSAPSFVAIVLAFGAELTLMVLPGRSMTAIRIRWVHITALLLAGLLVGTILVGSTTIIVLQQPL